MNANTFEELAKVDCSAYVEKKGKFTYLSWPFAFAELFKRFPNAQIDVREWDGFPAVRSPSSGWMVQVTVTIGDVRRSQWHPVLDNNNKPIAEPSVFQLNTSIQRAAVKAIALHGLGLYIFAGEDLPEGVEPEPPTEPEPPADDEEAASVQAWIDTITGCDSLERLEKMGGEIASAKLSSAAKLRAAYSAQKHALTPKDKAA